ncbi:hypothetical protein BUH_0244 [Burkholderia pseudomallei Pakistan 9]|uniref:Uncharacterized protein n=1 Tax=Burkholderia pseudomallei 1710a TaxID=320371 RepID=A0A0E1WBJ6_BURPE|nr:hypothetical protein GBP346_A0275 [Burkholderia pseudomallei MSHR346]EEC31366.1 hypothetical protein BUC_0541 [Burkholderia pseudomallei 576]EEH23706.1 hypothetical protein BUH_0244 [Burkholderia pseudomallei Pakistan 9]EET09711.1 hypothetical protein BURPS1710A_0628 [Burkholderia pseudomallei 1710a]
MSACVPREAASLAPIVACAPRAANQFFVLCISSLCGAARGKTVE